MSAESYAKKNDMAFFEVSPLCDYNVIESFAELSRLALKRNGLSRAWGPNKGEHSIGRQKIEVINFFILTRYTLQHPAKIF
jgi:hypothetical protein